MKSELFQRQYVYGLAFRLHRALFNNAHLCDICQNDLLAFFGYYALSVFLRESLARAVHSQTLSRHLRADQTPNDFHFISFFVAQCDDSVSSVHQ